MNQNITAKAHTLPKGAHTKIAELEGGVHDVKIIGVSEIFPESKGSYVACQYPCGLVREHEAIKIEDLVPKIENNFAARYGTKGMTIKSLPESIKEGGVIKVEIL